MVLSSISNGYWLHSASPRGIMSFTSAINPKLKGLEPEWSNRYNTGYDIFYDTHCNMILPVGFLPNDEHITEVPPNA